MMMRRESKYEWKFISVHVYKEYKTASQIKLK